MNLNGIRQCENGSMETNEILNGSDCNVTTAESGRGGPHVLITGGAGYIGSSLVPILLDSGYKVTVYDLFMWGVHSLLPHACNKNLSLIKGDILDRTK